MNETNGEALLLGRRKFKQYDFEFKKNVIEKIHSGQSVRSVCREFGIEAVSTVHGWMYKLKSQGGNLESMKPKSSRPHHQPKLTSQWIIDKILKIKKEILSF